MAAPPSAGPFQISKLIRTAFVTAMRTAFSTDTDYPYIENTDGTTDFDNSAIQIIDSTPQETSKFPAIIVNSIMDRGGQISFNDDFISETRDGDGNIISEEYGNQLRLNVDVEVWAYDSIVRDELVDKEYIYLKTLKDVFATFGVEIRGVTLITPRQETIGSRVHFVSGLSVDTYSEWTQSYDITPDQLISNFVVTIEKVLKP